MYTKRRYNYLLSISKTNKIDLSKKNFFISLFFDKSDLYEVNTINIFAVLAMFITGRISRTIFIDHNASRHYHGKKKSFLLFLLKYCKQVNVVNTNLANFYPPCIKTQVISPFLPPDETQEDLILQSYPTGLVEFMMRKNIFVNSAWKYVKYKKTDLYGLEASIDAAFENKKINLLLAIGVYQPELFSITARKKIEELLKEKRLFLLTGQKELWPIFKFNPIFLRLTPYDGDSVSVREALYFGCKVIASNTVFRPDECTLYPYADNDALLKIINEI